ncbi:hypothetical protein [Nesterenkonia sp. PF2B19]|uniref:hypothetical protein n=1 Tax=Nesterenkonia sp. PF2B19 TaxID=1881858 RepID=UPI0008727EE3|nr:hypothetical protein [Nesterenkonia sp. PF2B19]OSM42731.1 hypothetical protein BCY76_012560 [Nesterenkonia sp. PF2B19]
MTTSPEHRRHRPTAAELDGDAARIARRRRAFAVVVGVVLTLLVGWPVFQLLFMALASYGVALPWVGWLLGGFVLACLPAAAAVAAGTGSVRRGLLHGLWTGATFTVLAIGVLILVLG